MHNHKLKELIGIDIAPATHQRHETSKIHVAAFIKHQYGKDDLDIALLDHSFLNDFEHYFNGSEVQPQLHDEVHQESGQGDPVGPGGRVHHQKSFR